jgi:hypothetical protein
MTCARLRRAHSLAIGCYSKAWRSRHGQEAGELAAMLSEDGVPATILVWDLFKGSVRDRAAQLRARLGLAGLTAVLAAACASGATLAISVPSVPAGASGFGPTPVVQPARATQGHACAVRRSSPGLLPAGARNPTTTTALSASRAKADDRDCSRRG